MAFMKEQSSPSWYVIYTKPKQENRAEHNLIGWGLETFAPQYRERHQNKFAIAISYTVKPLFPRYIFARFQASKLLHKILFTRGICRVVGFGENATSVDDEVIATLKSKLGEDGYVRLEENIESGDQVVVKEGPLKGLTGICQKDIKDSTRVRILLDVIQYQGHILADIELVKKAS
jgi:transcriptional antiterminator RfaH